MPKFKGERSVEISAIVICNDTDFPLSPYLHETWKFKVVDRILLWVHFDKS